ncbi:MAG TPA: biotin transporter BioY [Parachlamydiaceae bacterium]|nr:biotin transporter BioY [Parachlamydiaceae bacterium]
MKKKTLIFSLGALFMVLMSGLSLSLPWTPIKLSLQSLSVSLLIILFMKDSCYGVLGYLVAVSLGLPVLAGWETNQWWVITPKAGYLIGFLISSLIVPRILERKNPDRFATSWLCFSLNEGMILILGWAFLSWHISPMPAWKLGVLPFLPGAVLKITIAAILWQQKTKRFLCRSIQNI